MTIKDLYTWAVENKVEDLNIGLQFQDCGGAYYGNTFIDFYENSGYSDFYDISKRILESDKGNKYILLE